MSRETIAALRAQSRAYTDLRMPIKAPADRLEGAIATAYSSGWLRAEVAATRSAESGCSRTRLRRARRSLHGALDQQRGARPVEGAAQ